MRAKTLLLATLLVALAGPARADPAPSDAPERWNSAVDAAPGVHQGSGGGLGDVADWFRIATVPGLAVHVHLTVTGPDTSLVIGILDAEGRHLRDVQVLVRNGIGNASLALGTPGSMHVGLIFNGPVAYELSLAHGAAPDPAVKSVRAVAVPLDHPAPIQIDPVHTGLQRRIEVVVKNEGAVAGASSVVIAYSGSAGARTLATFNTPVLAPGESVTVSHTATFAGAGDVAYRANLVTSFDVDLGNNEGVGAHYLLVGGAGVGVIVQVPTPNRSPPL